MANNITARRTSNEALEERVFGIERSLTGISVRLDTLSSQLAERSRPQWGLLISLASLIIVVVVTLGGIAYAPIISGLYRQEVDYKERIAETKKDLRDIQTSIVPRGEHEQIWLTFKGNISDHQRQLDEMKRTYSEIYSPKDALTSLQRRIDVLESRIKP